MPTLFDRLTEAGVAWRYLDAARDGTRGVMGAIDGLDTRTGFVFVYLHQIDMASHLLGVEGGLFRRAVRRTDELTGEVIDRLRARLGDIDLVLFSDHGMSQVRRTVSYPDLWTHPSFPERFCFALDATMVRLWFHDGDASLRSQIRARVSSGRARAVARPATSWRSFTSGSRIAATETRSTYSSPGWRSSRTSTRCSIRGRCMPTTPTIPTSTASSSHPLAEPVGTTVELVDVHKLCARLCGLEQARTTPASGGMMAKLAAVPGPIAARPLAAARRWDALRAVARGGSFVLGATLLWNLSNFAFNAVGARALGPGGYGQLAAVVALLYVVSPLLYALQATASGTAARLTSTDRGGDVRPQLRRQAWRAAGWTAFAVAVAALAAGQIAHALRLSSSLPVLLLLASMPLAAIVNLQRGAMQGIGHFERYAASTTIEAAAKIVLAARAAGALAAVEGAVLATAAALGCAALAHTRLLRALPAGSADRARAILPPDVTACSRSPASSCWRCCCRPT